MIKLCLNWVVYLNHIKYFTWTQQIFDNKINRILFIFRTMKIQYYGLNQSEISITCSWNFYFFYPLITIIEIQSLIYYTPNVAHECAILCAATESKHIQAS